MNKLNCVVYKITNLITNKFYIGATKNGIKPRKNQHLYHLRRGDHGNYRLQNDYNLYGEESLEFKPLLYCEESELSYYEQKSVDQLHPAYNIWIENINSPKGIQRSDEVRRVMSESRKGWVYPEERNRKIGEANRRRVLSEDTKRKIAESVKLSRKNKKEKEISGAENA